MAVAFDATSNVAAGTGNLSWRHTPSGTPKGVLVVVSQYGASGADQVSGVRYGGVAMARVRAALLTTGGEQAAVYLYFLGSAVQAGEQTVDVTVSGAASKRAVVYTLTSATAGTEVVASGTITVDSLANPSLDLAVPTGVEAFIAGCLFSGQNSTANVTPGANYTEVLEYLSTDMVASHVRRTANTSGGTTAIDWTQTAENACVAALAVAEVPLVPRPGSRSLLGVGR